MTNHLDAEHLTAPILLGMTTQAEQTLYRTLAQTEVQGVGEIVDLGCWLGATTLSMLAGLAQNPHPQARARKVYAYDRFVWEAYMNNVVQGSELQGKLNIGDDFSDEFRRRLGQQVSQVIIQAGDLCKLGWTGAPIEFLMVDVMKSAVLANCIWRNFYAALIPGRSIVIHQDFAHYYEIWIHLIHYKLRDYFEFLSESSDSCTVAFRYAHPIPQKQFETVWQFEEFTDAEIDAAYHYSLGLVGAAKQANVAAAHVAAYLHLNRLAPAQERLDTYLKQGYSTNSDLWIISLWLEQASAWAGTNAPDTTLAMVLPSSPAYALHQGIKSLEVAQSPSGSFQLAPISQANPAPQMAGNVPNLTLLGTSLLASSLEDVSHATAQPIRRQALNFLQAEMQDRGWWPHAPNKAGAETSQTLNQLPPRLDDLARNSRLLRRHNLPLPNNRWLILLNRNRDGLFYTWLIPRPVLTRNWGYWNTVWPWFSLKQVLGLERSTIDPDEIDAGVNAEVLAYLGKRAETRPVIDWLIQIVSERREANYLHSYDVFFFYYALSRAYANGATELQQIAPVIAARLAEAAKPDGQIGESVLQTALAVCTLNYFQATSPLVQAGVNHLINTQQIDGRWEEAPCIRNSDGTKQIWGSAALTTGFCLAALNLKAYWQLHSPPLSEPPAISTDLLSLLGMTSWYERQHYEEVAQTVMQGEGEIVDLGCWLGSTTASLAMGLAQNRTALLRKRKIFAYDRFQWDDYMNENVRGTALEGRYKADESFLDEFRQRIHPWANLVEVQAGDLLAQKWSGAPIEILLVDVMKTQELANFVLAEFYPHLIPGLSLVIHQDFAHFYVWWIHLIHYRLRDYFQPFADIQRSGTVTFRNTRPIPNSLLSKPWDFQAAADDEIDLAFAYCLSLTQDSFKRGHIAGAHVLAHLERGSRQRAQDVSDAYVKQGLAIEGIPTYQSDFLARNGILKST